MMKPKLTFTGTSCTPEMVALKARRHAEWKSIGDREFAERIRSAPFTFEAMAIAEERFEVVI